VFGADVLILQPFGLVLGTLEQPAEPRCQIGLDKTLYARQPFQRFLDVVLQSACIRPQFFDQRQDDTVGLSEQCKQQMFHVDLLMVVPRCKVLGSLYGLLGF
jgi:hypothetical protein